jgi:RNA polymerase sigma factor (sigma-70 family)
MTAPTESLLHYLHRLMSHSDSDASDAALLKRFVARNDESAFAALLARHGPMVHGVCRRILRDGHDAEDAFQATFLVLARKAGSLRRPEALASWLYGIARNLAYKARRADCRRRQREARCSLSVSSPAQGDLLDDLSARELLLALDEELARLPETYRLPLILCQLQGRTQEEAARLLGWTAGSVKGRLERGRKHLQARLNRRGLALSGAMLALTVLRSGSASAASRLTSTTVRAALAFAAGSTRGIAANVLTLAQSGVSSLTITKAKMSLMLLFALALAGSAGVLAYPLRGEKQAEETQATAAKTQERKIETPKPASEKTAPTDLYGDPLPSGAIARLGTVRFRHGNDLEGLFLSSDGRTLISAGVDAVRMWDVRSGRQQRQIDLIHPYNRIFGPDLSPDGKLLAVPFFNDKMRFWDLSSGAEVHPFGDDAPSVHRAAFSPSGEVLATYNAAPRGGVIRIWDIRKGKKIQSIEGAEGNIGKKIQSIEGAEGNIGWTRLLAFSPRGNMLAFPREGGVCVWDCASGKVLHQLESSAKTLVGCVAFSADGKLLAATSDWSRNRPNKDYAIHLWDLATGKEVAALQGHEDDVSALVMSPKGNLLASASSADGTIRFWDLDKRQEIGRSPGPARRYRALAYFADGKTLASGEVNGVLRLWDAQKHEEMAIPAQGSNSVQWVRFAPDGQTLMATTMEQIGLWEPLTGQPRRIFNNIDQAGYAPALSPDGKLLAAPSFQKRGQEAMLWDVASGKLVRKLETDGQARLLYLTFSADGRRVIGTSEQGVIYTWDVSNGKELRQLKVRNLSSPLAFAPDGATLVSSTLDGRFNSTFRLWSLASGEEMWRKEMPGWRAWGMNFAPDGRTLALAGGTVGRANLAGEVRLWDAATGKELKLFEGHRDHVFCAAFSADGRMLATGSRDKTIRLWEIATGRERRCLQGHKSLIWALSFSPDGRLLASASFDSTGLIWDLTGRFRADGFQLRRLSAEELNRSWADLAHPDAARAYQSILALTGSPKEAIALLKDRLPPLTAAEPKRVAPLLATLDSAQFGERDKAMSELEKMGLAVEPALRAALNDKPSLELRRRIEAVLEKLSGGPRLRFLRALEVLEHIATVEARQLLESLSLGTAEMWPTQEAKASLAHLAARAEVKP